MKKMIILVPVVALSLVAQAKIWRVNNMPGVTADFTTVQAAHDGANANDTIHIEPSPNNYGSVNSYKKLTWLSIGTYLSTNPGMQASPVNALISSMAIYAGSEGSIISVVASGSINVYCSNITISRSFVGGSIGTAYNISNLVITGSQALNISLEQCTNAIVTNNIVAATVGNNAAGSAIISNNVLNLSYRPEGYVGVQTLYNSVFQNNIIVKGGTYNFSNSQATYNTTLDAGGLPAGNNNVFSAVMTDIFVQPNASTEKDLMLKPGSPAIGTGSAGVDRGAYGGSTPFVVGLQPAIPAITALSSPASNNSSTIQVTFSAKSNQ